MTKLSRRERNTVIIGAALLLVFAVFQFLVIPVSNQKKRMEAKLTAKTLELGRVIEMKSEFLRIKQEAQNARLRFERRPAGFSLFSFLDDLAGDAGIKDNIRYMKPSQSVQEGSPYKISRVEMKFQDITMEELTPYLHMVETSPNYVNIKRISISKTRREDTHIDAILEVETLELG